jgi:hypothetical protein
MSSKIRRRQVRRGKSEVRHRKPGEVRTAVIAAALIVGFTLFGIWILCPGGLAHRQPRATALVAIALFATTIIVALAVKPPSPRVARRRGTWVPVSFVCVMIGMLVLWMAWGGDVVKHYPKGISQAPPAEITTPPTTAPTPSRGSAPTTAPGG